jgi:hypothetical protein
VIHVAALAEGREVGVGVVGGVVIAVSGGQHDLRRANDAEILDRRKDLERSSLSIAPSAHTGIPPAPVSEVVDRPSVRPTAALTGSASTAEADRCRKLAPINGIEEAVLTPNGHRSQHPGEGHQRMTSTEIPIASGSSAQARSVVSAIAFRC